MVDVCICMCMHMGVFHCLWLGKAARTFTIGGLCSFICDTKDLSAQIVVGEDS